jgi:hypothetical protein
MPLLILNVLALTLDIPSRLPRGTMKRNRQTKCTGAVFAAQTAGVRPAMR